MPLFLPHAGKRIMSGWQVRYRDTANGCHSDVAHVSSVSHVHIVCSSDGIAFVESWLRSDGPPFDLANKPYVFVHRLFGDSNPNSVMIDDRYGAHLGMHHLIPHGHRRIAF